MRAQSHQDSDPRRRFRGTCVSMPHTPLNAKDSSLFALRICRCMRLEQPGCIREPNQPCNVPPQPTACSPSLCRHLSMPCSARLQLCSYGCISRLTRPRTVLRGAACPCLNLLVRERHVSSPCTHAVPLAPALVLRSLLLMPPSALLQALVLKQVARANWLMYMLCHNSCGCDIGTSLHFGFFTYLCFISLHFLPSLYGSLLLPGPLHVERSVSSTSVMQAFTLMM